MHWGFPQICKVKLIHLLYTVQSLWFSQTHLHPLTGCPASDLCVKNMQQDLITRIYSSRKVTWHHFDSYDLPIDDFIQMQEL